MLKSRKISPSPKGSDLKKQKPKLGLVRVQEGFPLDLAIVPFTALFINSHFFNNSK